MGLETYYSRNSHCERNERSEYSVAIPKPKLEHHMIMSLAKSI